MKKLEKNIYIFSLKFSPGLFKEFYLIGEKLKKRNNVSFIISKNYKFLHKEYTQNKFDKENFKFLFKSNNVKNIFFDSLKYIFHEKNKICLLLKKNKPDIVFIYNNHPINFLIFLLAKKINPSCKNILFVHEPYHEEKKIFGLYGYLYFFFQELFQSISLKVVQHVVLPSPFAKKIFLSKHKEFIGKVHNVNLLLQNKPYINLQKKYFTFGGNLNKGKGLDEFVNLVNYSANKKLNYKFKIISNNELEKYLSNLSKDGRKILTIENKKNISDLEMNKTYAESIAFFLLHKTATQSGALATCFMNGTPVIAKNIEAFSQYINHQINSYLLPLNYETSDMLNAMNFVIKNSKTLSLNARNTYFEKFCDLHFEQMYRQIF